MSLCTNFTNLYLSGGIEGGYGALGFFIGCITGFIPCFICFWILCCFRRFKARSYNMACLEKLHSKRAENDCFEKFGSLNCLEDPNAKSAIKEKSVKTRATPPVSVDKGHKDKLHRKDRRRIEFLDPANILVELKLFVMDSLFTIGRDELAMIDAITQATEASGDLELTHQELRSAQQMEMQLWRNRLISFMGLCGVLLNLMLGEGLINEKTRNELRQKQTERLKKAKEMLDAKFKTRREAVANDKKLSTEEKQAATDAIDAEYGPQIGKQLQEEASNFERDIRHVEDLGPEEADRLLATLNEGQARLEGKLADQRLRLAAIHTEKLAERRRKLAEQKSADENVVYDLEHRLDSKRTQLEDLVADKRLTEAQAKHAMADYRKDLLKQKEAFEKTYLQQQTTLRRRMKEIRQKKLMEAESEAAQLQTRLASKVDAGTVTDPDVFIEEFERALESGDRSKEDLLKELDDDDCRQLEKLREELAREKSVAEIEIDENAIKQLGLSDDELRRMLAAHRSQTERFRQEKKKEKERQAAQLEEKLSHRQAKLAESIENQETELANVKKGQELVLKNALVFQVDLEENTKKQILDEHERNMQAMRNNIQVSRLKQETSLEEKLAARRANDARLKKEARDARLAMDDDQKADLDKLDSELARKLDESKKKMEAEWREGLQKLRDDLARETEEALRQQQENISQVIGRLQTGRARRRGVITAQERVFRELEAQLQAKLEGRVRPRDADGLDQVLQNFDNEVANLARQVDNERRHQEKQLAEEMQRRKLDKHDEVQETVEKEEEKATKALRESGHGRHVAKLVMDSVLDTKYRNSMMTLNEEMRMELRKQQEVLDREMEAELQAELEEQRKLLFTKLTALTDLSADEIKEMVDKAGRTAGLDRQLSRKLTKDFVGMVEETRGSLRSSRPKSSIRRSNQRYDNNSD